MRTGTVVSLGASAVLGLGALIVARVWLPQPAHAPTSPSSSSAAQDTVPVVVATSDIPYGTKLDASKLAVERLPAGAAPHGAYSTTQQVLGQSGGPPIVLTPISAREAILPDKLSGAGARATVAAVIGEGLRAYTIGITDVAGVGGHVLPGDRVDVMLTREIDPAPSAKPDAPDAKPEGKRYVSDVVLQDLRVLGMDLNADPTSTQAAVAHTATLEVSVQDAQKLAVASEAGTLSLALRRTGSAEVTPTHSIAVSDLLGGRGPMPKLIAVSRRTPASAAPILIRTHSVVIVHGDAAASVVVPAERFGGGA